MYSEALCIASKFIRPRTVRDSAVKMVYGRAMKLTYLKLIELEEEM